MYDLERFVKAQEYDYELALKEIRNGRKDSCWMWYIFPQISGLGMSSMAQYYELESLDEARAYLAHPVLGSRLQEICEAALLCEYDDPGYVFDYPDAMKFLSSMTLFEQADPDNPIYGKLIDKFYQGRRDSKTLEIIGK